MSKLRSVRDAIGQIHLDVDELRDRIGALQEERERVENYHVDRAEADRRIEALIDDSRRGETLRPYGLFAADRRVFDVHHFNAGLSRDPLGVLAALFPEQLRDALASHLPVDGVSEETRQARLAQLDADIEAAFVAEEVALRDLEEAIGTEVPRREEARPEIILAYDEELGRST